MIYDARASAVILWLAMTVVFPEQWREIWVDAGHIAWIDRTRVQVIGSQRVFWLRQIWPDGVMRLQRGARSIGFDEEIAQYAIDCQAHTSRMLYVTYKNHGVVLSASRVDGDVMRPAPRHPEVNAAFHAVCAAA